VMRLSGIGCETALSEERTKEAERWIEEEANQSRAASRVCTGGTRPDRNACVCQTCAEQQFTFVSYNRINSATSAERFQSVRKRVCRVETVVRQQLTFLNPPFPQQVK
jgi:hypothetical protein